MLSIVVPCLREAGQMAALAEHLRCVAPGAEVLVVDGASDDGTADAAEAAGLSVLRDAPRGRGRQMHLGAAQVGGDQLLFLHADTRLPDGVERLVAETLSDPAVALGAFSFAFDRGGARLAFVQAGARLRNQVARLPYGDQALFLRRAVYDAVGGYPAWQSMEDLELVLRARAMGRVVVRPELAVTSARRYVEGGPLRVMLRHWRMAARFARERERLSRAAPPTRS